MPPPGPAAVPREWMRPLPSRARNRLRNRLRRESTAAQRPSQRSWRFLSADTTGVSTTRCDPAGGVASSRPASWVSPSGGCPRRAGAQFGQVPASVAWMRSISAVAVAGGCPLRADGYRRNRSTAISIGHEPSLLSTPSDHRGDGARASGPPWAPAAAGVRWMWTAWTTKGRALRSTPQLEGRGVAHRRLWLQRCHSRQSRPTLPCRSPRPSRACRGTGPATNRG